MSAATAHARGSHPAENDDAARPGPSGPVGVPRWIWMLVAAAGAAGLAAAGWLTGVTAARQLSDPGWITRWGVPVGELVSNVAMSLTIAALIFAAGVLPPHAAGTERWHRSARQRREDADAAPLPEHPAFTRVMRIAAVSAGVWTVAALLSLIHI